MKQIAFSSNQAQTLYNSYLKRSKKAVKVLSQQDQTEILMEINSHIYEGIQAEKDANELERLVEVLAQLGEPEEVLKPLVADKKMAQATRTFHPVHVARALALNIRNGLIYFVFSLLYLLLFGGLSLIVAKLINPNEVGLYLEDGSFALLGRVTAENAAAWGYREVLGQGFIPTMLGLMVVFYLLITLMLKLKQKLK